MPRARPAMLIIGAADGTETILSLAGDITTIGRSESCDVVVAHSTVSRLHARIALELDRYMISDAGSANGTFVNGEPVVESRQLGSGDEIWLGSAAVALQFSDPDETLNVAAVTGPPSLEIDQAAREVRVHGAPVALTTLEYELLRFLAEAPHTVRTREECFLAVWGEPYDHATCEDALNACIARLRRNLRAAAESVGHTPPQITTIKRVGLRLDTNIVVSGAARGQPPRERAVGLAG